MAARKLILAQLSKELIGTQGQDPAKPAKGSRNLSFRSELFYPGNLENQTETDERERKDVAAQHPFAMCIKATADGLDHCEAGSREPNECARKQRNTESPVLGMKRQLKRGPGGKYYTGDVHVPNPWMDHAMTLAKA